MSDSLNKMKYIQYLYMYQVQLCTTKYQLQMNFFVFIHFFNNMFIYISKTTYLLSILSTSIQMIENCSITTY